MFTPWYAELVTTQTVHGGSMPALGEIAAYQAVLALSHVLRWPINTVAGDHIESFWRKA